MADYRDPAIRLHNVVEKAAGYADNTKIRDGWAKALGIEGASDSELLRELGKLISLPSQIRQEFAERGLPTSPALDRLHKVETALGFLNLNAGDWKRVKAQLSQDARDSLRYASHELSRGEPPQDLEEETLESLLEMVREVTDGAISVAADDRLKRFVVDHLRMVEQAIQDYRLDGGATLERIARCAAGEVASDHELRRAHVNREPVLGKFWRTLAKVSLVLNVAGAAGVLPPPPESASLEVHQTVDVDADVHVGGEVTVHVIRDDLNDAIRELAEFPALESGSGAGDTEEDSTPPVDGARSQGGDSDGSGE